MIKDKYTYAPLSRQRKYQLRMKDKGKCIICGKKATTSHFCSTHAEQANVYSRAYYQRQREKDAGPDNT